jgi:DNA repair protein RadD
VQSRKHGQVLRQAMDDNEMHAVFVDGDTPKDELTQVLDDFAARKFKYLINVALLVEGWDCPQVDCIAMFCSTQSKGKFEQALYRGTRPCEGKKDFLVLDMGKNFQLHGALGSPYRQAAKGEKKKTQGKICPRCETFTPPISKECPDCGFEFPLPEAAKVSHTDAPDNTTSMTHTGNVRRYQVFDVSYEGHINKKGKTCIKAIYTCTDSHTAIRKYISPYSEKANGRAIAKQFFKRGGWDCFGDIKDYSLDDLLYHASNLKKPKEIVVDHFDPKYPDVTMVIYDAD